MMLWLLLILGTFANVAQAQDNVDATQLQGWQNFFDKTNGGSWTRCRGKRNSPCTCSGGASTVTCQDVDGTLFITSIQLRNNGLSGVNVPGAELESIVGGFSGFTSLDISQNPNLKNTRGGCIRIPSCTTGTATCNVGYTICTDSGTSSPSTTGTTAPTPLVTVPGATAWRRFFDATSGTSWTRCSSTRTAPCNCQRNQVATAPVRVVCTGSVITRISMINNNLNAATFPAQDVSDLIRAGAAYIDLTGNPGLAANESCVNVPECNSGGVICIFEQPLCSTTLSPGISPNTPTTSPSPNNNQTSASPTSSVPTTSSPSAVGSASPSVTSSPTTISSPPSVAPPPTNTTKSPTVQPGSTGVPTTTSPSSNQTSSPSSSGTRSPTQTPVTKSPTSPVQTSSFSPTPSSSNKIQGITVAATVMSVCLAALAF